jgi:Cupin-like domain
MAYMNLRSYEVSPAFTSTHLCPLTSLHPVPLSTGEWLLSFWDAHLEAKKNLDPKLRPFEAIVEEGEMIFVPHGYWHMVVNLDDCIAITQNYVSTSNLGDCLKFLREKPDQISGG